MLSFLHCASPAALLTLMLLPAAAPSQQTTTEEITFFSADGVELEGTFYPPPRGGRSPCVLLLHKLGGSRQDDGLGTLALELQKAGFAVLSFDFRGHGGSVNVHRDFWLHPAHRSLRGFHPTRTQISHQDFASPSHHALLVNDVAAARHVLDLRSHAGQCDSSRIIVVGVDTGATLGALWVASEWERARTVRGPGGKTVRLGAEGHDIAGAVWLGISPTLGGRQPVPLDDWLTGPPRERVPMAFLYSKEDADEAKVSAALVEAMQKGGKERVHRFTTLRGVDADGGLLAASSTPGMVSNYVRNVLKSARTVVRPQPGLGAPPLVPLEQFGIR